MSTSIRGTLLVLAAISALPLAACQKPATPANDAAAAPPAHVPTAAENMSNANSDAINAAADRTAAATPK